MCVGMLKKVLGTPSPMKSVIDSVPSPIGDTGAEAIGAGVTATKAAKKRASLLAYGAHLEQQRIAGAVAWFRFEGVKLRLADNTFYTPDYAVMRSDGLMECHEVKGFWQDDARAKVKIAAEMYPFRFVAVKAKAKKDGGGWEQEVFE
jgi:hypothetical protein